MVRAALIALVLLLHASLAAPWPDLTAADLRYGVAQDELKRWSALLTSAGRPTTPQQLGQEVLALGQRSRQVQGALHGPFRPLLRLTGTGQAWGLFAYPDPYAGRLVISVQRAGASDWQEVYRAPGQGRPDVVELVEYRRVRGIYDDKGDRPRPGYAWARLCDYLAARLMAGDPAVEAVELRLDLVTLRVPGAGGEAVPDKRRHVQVRSRADVAEALGHLGAAADGAAPPVASPVGP